MPTTEIMNEPAQLTPARIVAELDKYIIGQREAKKAVAIALRNRWRRMNADPEIGKEIMPNNILMIGATGVGKTEIARRLAQLAQAPFVKVEASKFTEVGYVGRDVESMVRDLAEQAVQLVRAEFETQYRVQAEEAAEEALLDLLFPDSRPEPVVAGTGFILPNREPAPEADGQPLTTREKLRIRLRNGELDDRKVEIEITAPAGAAMAIPMGMEGMEGLQELLNNMAPKKKKKRSVSVADARAHLVNEELQKLIDMEAVTREAVQRAEQSGVIFIDEIDKVASGAGRGGGPDVSREGVQRDLLPIVEGSTVNTRYGQVKTDHVLFVAAGAFHVSKPSDLIPELQGRFPIRVELSSLTREDFVNILTQPRNALTRQFQALLASEGVELHFEASAIDAIADVAFEVNEQVENIGARRLHTIMSVLLDDLLFDTPDQYGGEPFTVTADFVHKKLSHIARSTDLSRYIL